MNRTTQLTYSILYLWSAQKWQAGMGDCRSRLLCPAVLSNLWHAGCGSSSSSFNVT